MKSQKCAWSINKSIIDQQSELLINHSANGESHLLVTYPIEKENNTFQ